MSTYNCDFREYRQGIIDLWRGSACALWIDGLLLMSSVHKVSITADYMGIFLLIKGERGYN